MATSTNTLARDGAGISQSEHDRLLSGSIPARATKYSRVGPMTINPLSLVGHHSAFDLARLDYSRHATLHFEADLVEYCRNGYVVSRPNLFGLAKELHYQGKRGWFIRYAIGSLLELMQALPHRLDLVLFCRNNDDDMRVVEYDAFMKTVTAMNGR